MNAKLRTMLGIDFPLLAFSHCRDVVAAVSKAGGFGVGDRSESAAWPRISSCFCTESGLDMLLRPAAPKTYR